METLDSWGGASFDLRGLIGRIYVRNQSTLDIAKAVDLIVSESEENFKVFPIISLWELYVAMTTRVPIQSAQNQTYLMQTFPPPDDALHV